MEKTPWLRSANRYDFPFTQSPLVLLTGDYGSVPRRMSVSSSEESSLDPAAELARISRCCNGHAYNGFSVVCIAVFILFGIVGCIDPSSQAALFHMTVAPSSATAPSTIIMSSRPKTSHTTIERRYRTNLNARIQSLRVAVPAL
ncbi:hypothetical protein EV421DRAFT_2034711 [Armillaria borealis]|uniref:BHLH domain-containing protein n=1 Tax=Armillaria borealis TaxID=47425 RepID=A0AA39JM19_9AGAR|nr:hypothetical protein EV421DRAFT_2034711 [Armillaria borealis]